MGSLAHPQALLEGMGEVGGQGSGRHRIGERRAQLTEDLGLADRHRVESAGDLEEVLEGLGVVVGVEVPGDVLPFLVDRGHECVAEVGEPAVEGGDVGDEFEAVARREDGETVDARTAEGVGPQTVDVIGAEGQGVEHVDRRRLVGDAENQESQLLCSSTGVPALSSSAE